MLTPTAQLAEGLGLDVYKRQYLGSVHLFAFSCICEVYARHGIQVVNPAGLAVSKKKARDALSKASEQIASILTVEASHPDLDDATDALFASRRLIDSQLRLIHHYNGTINANLYNPVSYTHLPAG